MLKFILKRLLQAIPIVIATTFVAYGIIRAAPGDPVQLLVGDPKKIPQSYIEGLKKQLGLDKPWYVSYVYWLRNLVYNPAPPPIVDLALLDDAQMDALEKAKINLRVDKDTRVFLGDQQLTMRQFATVDPERVEKKSGSTVRVITRYNTVGPVNDILAKDRDAEFFAVFLWEKTQRATGIFDTTSANDNEVSNLQPRDDIIVESVDPTSGTLTYRLKYGDKTPLTVQLDDTYAQLRLKSSKVRLGDLTPGMELYLVTKEVERSKLFALSDAAGRAHIEDLGQYQYEGAPLNPQESGLYAAPVHIITPTPIAYPVKHFDLGESFNSRRPVTELFMEALNNTFLLVLLTLILDFLIAVPVGIIVALKKNTWIDYILTFCTFTFISLPSFWFVLILIMTLAYEWRLLPSGGMNTEGVTIASAGLWAFLGDRVRHLIIPLAALTLPAVASTMRYSRAAVLDVIHQDYVRTAKAKGLPHNKVILRHVLKNAMIPIITLIGLSFPFLISGSFIVEQICSWPGMGKLSLTAVFQRDYPVIMAGILFGSMMIIAGQLLADILYAWANPRIRKSFEGS